MKRLLKPVLWLLVLASLFPLWAASRVGPSALGDDALITLTYAKNLARGDGFVFNHPPPVLGTTTPLYALVVAALGTVLRFVDLTTIALFVSALCWVGLVWCWFVFRREFSLTDWQACILGIVMSASGWVRHLEMEAYLFALLLTVATGLFFRGRLAAAGAASALLVLTRGEGALLFGILFVLAIVAERRDLKSRSDAPRSGSGVLSLCTGFAIPMLAWSVYAQITFGSVIPNTLAAKVAQGTSGLWRPFLEQLVGVWMPSWGRGLALPGLPLLGVWYLLVVIGLVVAARRHRPLLVLVVWTIARCRRLPVVWTARVLRVVDAARIGARLIGPRRGPIRQPGPEGSGGGGRRGHVRGAVARHSHSEGGSDSANFSATGRVPRTRSVADREHRLVGQRRLPRDRLPGVLHRQPDRGPRGPGLSGNHAPRGDR
jgi:hypothetical protein